MESEGDMPKLHEDQPTWDLDDPTLVPELILQISAVLARWRAGEPASVAVQGALAAAAQGLLKAIYAID